MNLKHDIESKNITYQNSNPFPHIILDDFLPKQILVKLVEYSKSLKLENCCNNRLPPNKNTQYKYAYQNFLEYPNEIKMVFNYLNSDSFISKLEKLTGISNIISNNTSLEGGGFHKITNNGFLNLHTDFNNYADKNLGSLDRRINILIYLNPGWKEEYKGHLWLCNKNTKKIEKKILPILNRCVIFNTTNESIHGHPERLNIPETITRDSLALYYYTRESNNNLDFEGDKYHSTIYYNTNDFS